MAKTQHNDEEPKIDAGNSHDTRRRLKRQVSVAVGEIDEETLDELEYEVEFETFEPLPRRRSRKDQR